MINFERIASMIDLKSTVFAINQSFLSAIKTIVAEEAPLARYSKPIGPILSILQPAVADFK